MKNDGLSMLTVINSGQGSTHDDDSGKGVAGGSIHGDGSGEGVAAVRRNALDLDSGHQEDVCRPAPPGDESSRAV